MKRNVLPLVLMAAFAVATRAAAQGTGPYFVDTTADGPESLEHCVEGQPCPLRSAVHIANQTGGGLVTARICAQQGDPGCLSTNDPNYDPISGQWTFHLDSVIGALILDREGVVLDFRTTPPIWNGPADNVVVVDGGRVPLAQGIVVQGLGHRVAGLEVVGRFSSAAIEMSANTHNVILGPGIVVVDVEAAAGIRLRDASVTGNSVVGNWCGIRGDGSEIVAVRGDCLLIDRGAAENTIGGMDAGEPNFLAAATGSGIRLEGPGADRNRVVGNVIGLGPTGVGMFGGPAVDIVDSGANIVENNVIAAAAGAGLRIRGTSFGNQVRENAVGYRPGPDGIVDEPYGNTGWGIELRELAKGTVVEHNTVQYNRGGGVVATGGQAENNLFSQNRIRRNGGPAVRAISGANGGIEAPLFSIVTADRASGIACSGCTVELFSDEGGQAWHYEGSVAVTGGSFIFSKAGGFLGPFLTSTATRSGNTSSLSGSEVVPGAATPTPDRPTDPPPQFDIFIPLVAQHWSR